ncbi:porin [Cupriavidus basilensis]|uniref:porin n=1 Tax=Cupriavidus basilensis TaxID=68895 RepID=UPI00157B1F16|nr:porin [Cupriavidus basilensis]
MKNHIIIPSILAGLAASAANAQGSVTLYGILDAYMESAHVGGNGAGTGSVQKLTSGGLSPNRWGMRGEEALGGGMKARFVLEGGFSEDTGIASMGGRLFGRQSTVGLAGPFGEVTFGRRPAPLNGVLARTDIETGLSAFSPLSAVSVLDTNTGRQDNHIRYISPRLGGFTGQLSFAPGERTVLTNGLQNNMYGASLDYRSGPALISMAYHQAGTSATSSTTFDTKQRAFVVGGVYDFNVVRVAATYWDYTNQLSGRGDPHLRAYAIGASVPLGAWSAMAQIGLVQDNGLNLNTGNAKVQGIGRVRYLNVGANYQFSKRTELYTRFARVQDSGAGYGGVNTAALATLALGTLQPGQSARTIALGVRHYF